MIDNYAEIVRDNLKKLYENLPQDLQKNLPGKQEGKKFIFHAFGETCVIEPEGIRFGDRDREYSSVFKILISLYALNACPDICLPTPFKAFKAFENSMPYVGAFATHTEQILIPHVSKIKHARGTIMEAMKGESAPEGTSGDFSFVVYPLPKIALCYIFYEADDDFPASVTCLFSNNAGQFLPVDGLADVGEYCSGQIITLVSAT